MNYERCKLYFNPLPKMKYGWWPLIFIGIGIAIFMMGLGTGGPRGGSDVNPIGYGAIAMMVIGVIYIIAVFFINESMDTVTDEDYAKMVGSRMSFDILKRSARKNRLGRGTTERNSAYFA